MSTKDACLNCLRTVSRTRIQLSGLRNFSRTLTTETTAESSATVDLSVSPSPKTRNRKSKKNLRTSAGIVLSRPPLITRELTEFEKAFYQYQRHLQSRLSSPFPLDFYFQKGSLAAKRWQAGEEARARSLQLMPDEMIHSEQGEMTSEARAAEEEEGLASTLAASRETEADRTDDTKSLNRKLSSNLYLLIKKKADKEAWQLPHGPVGTGEVLHEAARRTLDTLCGVDMNTWIVGRVPIGHTTQLYASKKMDYDGAKIYFMKARILAGQAQLMDRNVQDFAWLTREEIEKTVSPHYWTDIDAILD